MKKNFNMYFLIWLVLVLTFNAIAFIIQQNIYSDPNIYNRQFYLSLIFINLSFVINLICAYSVFNEKNADRLFYNISLITISWSLLIVIVVVGLIIMFNPNIKTWMSLIIYLLIIATNLISLTSAKWTSETISELDNKVKHRTDFMNNLISNAETITYRCKNDEIKKECRDLCDIIRYSDPVSNDKLFEIENNISLKLNELSDVIDNENAEDTIALINDLKFMLHERNEKCKKNK